jgi:ketosteroid isomerase-like protein
MGDRQVISQVLAAQRDWLATVRAKNFHALLKGMTDDILAIHPNRGTVRGIDELCADFEHFFI